MQSENFTRETDGDSVANTRLQCSRNRVPMQLSIKGFNDFYGPFSVRKSLRLHGYGLVVEDGRIRLVALPAAAGVLAYLFRELCRRNEGIIYGS